MKIIRIESPANAEYKRLLQLHHPNKARKEGVFLLEGERAVKELPANWKTESIWVSASYAGYIPEKSRVFSLSDTMFQKAAETVHAQGILAVVKRPVVDQDSIPARAGLWILLENLQDPGNAGTILRTADACGADGILCTKGTVDFFNPKVIRSSMGSLFHVPVMVMDDIQDAVDFVHAKGCQVVGTHLRTSFSYLDPDYQAPVGILIGNEGSGMSEEAASQCDTLVKIPMPGRAESLNASVAAAVMMYEVLRQRG